MTPDEFHLLRDVEQAETEAVDILISHPALNLMINGAVVRAAEDAMKCGCAYHVLLYHTLWLGHYRIVQSASDRMEYNNDGPDPGCFIEPEDDD